MRRVTITTEEGRTGRVWDVEGEQHVICYRQEDPNGTRMCHSSCAAFRLDDPVEIPVLTPPGLIEFNKAVDQYVCCWDRVVGVVMKTPSSGDGQVTP